MRVAAVAILVVLALAAATVHARSDYSPAALKDEITNLPDAPKVSFRMFSGYVPVNAAGTRKIFYWFVESQNDPVNDPLFLWTNGGPGCSGLIGKFTENGPFVPNADGTLSVRETSWNRLANFIFIEQPAGVGFSQPESRGINWSDETTANDNTAFIRGFLKKFPNYVNNALYLSSESYGGHYLPTLALNIVKNASELNFKGFLVGNPLSYMPHRDYGQYATYAFRQLIPRPEWDAYIDAGCRPDPTAPATNPPPARPSACDRMEMKFDRYASGMDPYAIDFPICTASAGGRGERAHFLKRLELAKLHLALNGSSSLAPNRLMLGTNARSALEDYFPDKYEPCVDNYASAYLNRADVQKAIHAEKPVSGEWSECSNINFSSYDMITAMMPIYRELIQRRQAKLNMLIFSGDNDAICATPDAQLWLWNMGLNQTEAWRQWKHEGQVAGMTVGFTGLRFATIHGAGHMCPTTRPHQSLRALQNFLTGKW